MAREFRKYVSTGTLDPLCISENPTLSLRSEPSTNRANFQLSFDSDHDSFESSSEFLDSLSLSRMFSQDTCSLSDMSPMSIPEGASPIYSPPKLNFGKRRMAPQPPIIHRREHSEPTYDDMHRSRPLTSSKSEENLDELFRDHKRRTKSSDYALTPEGKGKGGVSKLSNNKRLKIKAAFRIAGLYGGNNSPTQRRKNSKKEKREKHDSEGSSSGRNSRARKNGTVEPPDPEVYLNGVGIVPAELATVDMEFEVRWRLLLTSCVRSYYVRRLW